MLTWKPTADPIDETEQDAWSGGVTVGNVKRSGSGRWRWSITALPGDSGFRDERSGWCESETEAKHAVENRWRQWLSRADLSEKE